MTGDELMELGAPGPLRDRLVAAVLEGQKTATSSLLVQYEGAQEPPPTPGSQKVLIDSAGKSVGTVEVVDVEVIRLGDADLRLALDEGEGFVSVAHWREAHEEFWRDEVLPELRLPGGWRLCDDTLVVVERFKHSP
jgi:uncharacterized protein YhfF